jgi:hypothetical protein
VKLLLQQGMSPHSKDKEGRTPLHIGVSKLAGLQEIPRRLSGRVDPPHEETIVYLLLEVERDTPITDDVLCAASEIYDEETRTNILEKMLPRAESHYFPEHAFRLLIKASRSSFPDGGGFMQKLLDEKRIRHITTSMLAVAKRPEMVTKLLDYDTTYKITTETLDALFGPHQYHSRQVVKLLLTRDESFMPGTSNVMAVLKQKYTDLLLESPEDKKFHVLEMMFSRNSQLHVTEDMLMVTEQAEDREVLANIRRRMEA